MALTSFGELLLSLTLPSFHQAGPLPLPHIILSASPVVPLAHSSLWSRGTARRKRVASLLDRWDRQFSAQARSRKALKRSSCSSGVRVGVCVFSRACGSDGTCWTEGREEH